MILGESSRFYDQELLPTSVKHQGRQALNESRPLKISRKNQRSTGRSTCWSKRNKALGSSSLENPVKMGDLGVILGNTHIHFFFFIGVYQIIISSSNFGSPTIFDKMLAFQRLPVVFPNIALPNPPGLGALCRDLPQLGATLQGLRSQKMPLGIPTWIQFP